MGSRTETGYLLCTIYLHLLLAEVAATGNIVCVTKKVQPRLASLGFGRNTFIDSESPCFSSTDHPAITVMMLQSLKWPRPVTLDDTASIGVCARYLFVGF